MPTITEWTQGRTAAGVCLPVHKVLAYRQAVRSKGESLPESDGELLAKLRRDVGQAGLIGATQPEPMAADIMAQILQRHPARLDTGYGPGTELRDMLAELWLTPRNGCGCPTRLKVMNGWGVEGCRYNRDKIVGWLREAAAKTTRWLRMRAGFRAVWVRLVWELPWRDPYGGLVDLAVYRAERRIASDKR